MQTAGRCTPFNGFPLTSGRGGAPLGGGRKPGWDRDAHFCGNPEVSLLGLEGRPGGGGGGGGSLQLFKRRRARGRGGDCVVSLSLAPSHRQPGWRGNPEMNVKFLFSRSTALGGRPELLAIYCIWKQDH